MKDSVQIAVFFMLQHLSFVIGIVTIDFSSIGYIDQSIVLQCKDTDNITVSRANWYQGGTLLDLSSSRYNQTTLPDGFSLKISSLRSTDGGVYHCGIEFGTSSTKTLTIYYNTVEKDVKVEGNIITTTIAITIIAFPDPVYNINVTQDGNLTYVNWNVTKTTKTNGAIEVLLQNSTAFQDKIYTVVVTITSPVNLVVTSNISFVQTTPAPTSSCQCPVGLPPGIGITLGISTLAWFIAIVIWIVKGLDSWILCLILYIIFSSAIAVGIICIVILGVIGAPCSLALRLGLGISFGVIILACIICIVILAMKMKGDCCQCLSVDKNKKSTGPPVIHTGTQNKVDQKVSRPLPHLGVEYEDKPKHRPQPPPPENSDVKDRNLRGLSANYDDKQGLATEAPRSSRLPPLLPPMQPTVEEEVTSEEPKKKKKKKKKKEQMNEVNHEEEITK